MNTTRRNAIRYCLLLTVGGALLPSCMLDSKKPGPVLKNLVLDGNEALLLASITETILPGGNGPGAGDNMMMLFVLKMVDDLYSPEEQKQFINGMRSFDKLAAARLGEPFYQADEYKKEALITGLLGNERKDGTDSVPAFLKTMKKLTIQGYTGSRYYLTKIKLYELVPGRFHGCFPVNAAKKNET